MSLLVIVGVLAGIAFGVGLGPAMDWSSGNTGHAATGLRHAPSVESAHGLFLWPATIVGERAPSKSKGSSLASTPVAASPVLVASKRPRAASASTKTAKDDSMSGNLLSAGL